MYVGLTEPAPEAIAPELSPACWRQCDVDTGRLANVRVNAIGPPLSELVRTGLTYGATRAQHGWNHSLATLADCLTMTSAFEGPLSVGSLAAAARFLADPSANAWSTRRLSTNRLHSCPRETPHPAMDPPSPSRTRWATHPTPLTLQPSTDGREQESATERSLGVRE